MNETTTPSGPPVSVKRLVRPAGHRCGFWGTLGCLVGLHRWSIVGYNSILNPLPVERCDRCGIGRQFHVMGAEFRFTREQMDEACKPNAGNQGQLPRKGTDE